VIEDTKVLLERVEPMAIKHVNKSGIKVAHSLSQTVISQMGDFIWLEAIPQCNHSFVLALLLFDFNEGRFYQKKKKSPCPLTFSASKLDKTSMTNTNRYGVKG
jgi:hypothetical protein